MSEKRVQEATEIISKFLSPNNFKDISVQEKKKVVFNLLLENPSDTKKKDEIIKELEKQLSKAGFTEVDVYTTQKPDNLQSGHRPIGGTANRGNINS